MDDAHDCTNFKCYIRIKLIHANISDCQDLFIPGGSPAALALQQNDSCHYSTVNGLHPLGVTKNKNVTHMTHTANETGV